LDAVSHSQQSQTLRELNPRQVVFGLLNALSEREKNILAARYGLDNGEVDTLEKIGGKLHLTRERVRQIEKAAISKLRKIEPPRELNRTTDLIRGLLESTGGIMTEEGLISTLLPAKTETLEKDILFVFQLSPDFTLLADSRSHKKSWVLATADLKQIKAVIDAAIETLKELRQAVSVPALLMKAAAKFPDAGLGRLSDSVFENYLTISKRADRNIFDLWGLAEWPDIRPKDVGDKAYLVLKKSGEPRHYHVITDLINRQKFDVKTAQNETVHNELIKDERFILVGRGIYALKEWGYRGGTVGDVIEQILRRSNRALGRQEIINAVLEQRLVKKNTIVVGLSNKSRFKKTPENKYTIFES